MRSFKQTAKRPPGKPVLADDIVEFHAARLLLLIDTATRSRIEGLTKLAKLDFFVRYPSFFQHASESVGRQITPPSRGNDSAMIRFHYGPWDPRYYQVIPFMEARELIIVDEDGRAGAISFTATGEGRRIAALLRTQPEYDELRAQIESVVKTFGRKSGNQLKTLIYELFKPEVADRRIGERIG